MIYIGIDISKYKHDFCIISNTGEIIVENSSFENNKKGFQFLLDQLKPYNKSRTVDLFLYHYSHIYGLVRGDSNHRFLILLLIS